MHPHTGTHKHKLSYRNALLSLWFSCKPNKSYPLRSACFCSWLPRVRLSWKKGISIHSLPGCVLWGIKHTFRYYVIHWEVWIWGQYQMSGNLKERRKTMTGKIHMQRVYFEALQLIKRWGSTDLVTVQKSNGWIVWFWKVINTKILFPSTVSVKPEKVTLKRQWVWDNHWKHLPPCQHSFHSSDAWGCQHGHVSQQSWTSSLFSVVFFCLFFFFFSPKWIWTSVMQMAAIKIWHGPLFVLLTSKAQVYMTTELACRSCWHLKLMSWKKDVLQIPKKVIFKEQDFFLVLAWTLRKSVMKK